MDRNAQVKVGIVGHGNLGRGVEHALARSADMSLEGIYTRRDPGLLRPVTAGVPVHPIAALDGHRDRLDVLILCGGSKSDLPEQTPALAAAFNVVDSFDTHARIPEHFAAVDAAATGAGRISIISVGWDPGLFSLYRLFGEASLPAGDTYTFWGKGLSQGHSDAVRRIAGVKQAVQYTIPVPDAVERVRAGTRPTLTTREKHTRECFVVLEDGADAAAIREAIVSMPDYFSDYDTIVHFISEAEMARDHNTMPHGGFVLRSGETGEGTEQLMESSLTLGSNPEFTASVLVAYARAAVRMQRQGQKGARTVFDVAPGLLSPKSPEELRAGLL